MATLQELLLTPENGPKIVADLQSLIDSEIDSKGITAAPIKAAYKVVTSFAPGYLTDTIGNLLPGMTAALEPYWAEFLGSGGADFGDFLAKRGGEVSESLLKVTDEEAEQSGRAVIVKAYKAVRGSAGKNIEAALPGLGAAVQKYA